MARLDVVSISESLNILLPHNDEAQPRAKHVGCSGLLAGVSTSPKVSLQIVERSLEIAAIGLHREVVPTVTLESDTRRCLWIDSHGDRAALLDVILMCQPTAEDVVDIVPGRSEVLILRTKPVEEKVKVLRGVIAPVLLLAGKLQLTPELCVGEQRQGRHKVPAAQWNPEIVESLLTLSGLGGVRECDLTAYVREHEVPCLLEFCPVYLSPQTNIDFYIIVSSGKSVWYYRPLSR